MPEFAEGEALTTFQQALYLGVNRDTIRVWKKRGYLPNKPYLTPAELREGRDKVPPKRAMRTAPAKPGAAAPPADAAPAPGAVPGPAPAPPAAEPAKADPEPAKPGVARLADRPADLSLPPGPAAKPPKTVAPDPAPKPASPGASPAVPVQTVDLFEGWR